MHISWARLTSFCHLGFISDPLIVSKLHNETHDPKVQENKIYTIVKGRETFYCRHTVPVTSCSEVKCVLYRVSFGSKDCTKELKLECAYFLGIFLTYMDSLYVEMVSWQRPQCVKSSNPNLTEYIINSWKLGYHVIKMNAHPLSLHIQSHL